MNKAKVLDRIKKLLAMANDDRGNDNERETALRQAHKLLTKHNLSLLEVEEAGREAEDPRVSSQFEGWSMPWTRQVRQAIGRLFMCNYYVGHKVNGTRQAHYYVGRESNVVTAEYMSTYVIDNILKQGRKLYGHNLSPATRSFATGCAVQLHARVDEMIAKAAEGVEGATQSTAIALLDLAKAEKAANDDFVSDWNVQQSRSRRTGRVDFGAYNEGKAHANGINLDLQLATDKKEAIR